MLSHELKHSVDRHAIEDALSVLVQFIQAFRAGELDFLRLLDHREQPANRLNRTSTKGGIQQKEYLAKYGADRVRTLGAVWLGQTLGCAECHDHKFDPITHEDFYAMKAFFAVLKHRGPHGGALPLPTPEQQAALGRLDPPRTEANQALAREIARLTDERASWEKQGLDDARSGQVTWEFQRPVAATADQDVQLHVCNDEIVESELYYDGSNYQRAWGGGGGGGGGGW